MSNLLNTGKTALFAYQRALATTSHNIANVNTKGYSRQRVDFEALPGNPAATIPIGYGVQISDIKRMDDQFANARVNNASSAFHEEDIHFRMASRLDDMAATEGMSVAEGISQFFNALQDANMDPTSTATREVLVDRTEQLAHRFRAVQEQLEEAQIEANDKMEEVAMGINDIAASIADLNQQIVSAQAGGRSKANDLLDQRDQLITQLSEFVNIDTVAQDHGSVNVYMGNGLVLVNNNRANSVATARSDIFPDEKEILLGSDGNMQVVTQNLEGGKLGGLRDFINETLKPSRQQLGYIALTLADQLNAQHSRGLDLNGTPGGALFEMSTPQVYTNNTNTGNAQISVGLDDVSALLETDYTIRYDGTDYVVTRDVDGVSTTGTLPMTLDGLLFAATGSPAAGDHFVVSATGRAAASIQSLVDNPSDLALSGQLTTNSALSNLGDARISTASVIDPEAISLTVPVEIRFTDDNTYDLVETDTGTVVSAGNAYVDGAAINLNGWEVSIVGVARSGDIHTIRPSTTGKGNNSNGQALAELQTAHIVGGTDTFNDAYGSFVARIGAQTHSAKTRSTALEKLMDNAIDRQQSDKGVSLDEEAINMTRFQQAYQASAQIISIADELFDAILGAVR